MKQSDLKEYIKEEIISVLSEDTKEEIEDTKELTVATKELADAKKELVGEGSFGSMADEDVEKMGYEEGENIFSRMREEQPSDLRAYFRGLKQGFLNNLGSYDLNEDIDDDEADKSASKGAKGKDAVKFSKKSDEDLKKQTMKQKVADFTAEMVKKGIVDDNGKILDTPKYVKEFAKFKSKKK